MSQSAAADLPAHKGLFNLSSPPPPPAQAAPEPARTAQIFDGKRIEPRLVTLHSAVSPAPSPAPAAVPAPVAKPAARPQLAVASTNLAPRGAAPAGGNAQVQPKPQAVARKPVESGEPISRGRFLKTIEHLAKTEEAKAAADIVTRVRAREVEQAVQHAARARARYLACVVDLGANRAPVGRANVAELAELRLAHEELSKGIDALTDAIREGLIDIVGVGE
ncbi:MAG: hypothetical protein GC202_06535 [Alphaproteobacteria bacterium]|nr:hypothetical protein [Alphaproteobacteria bacterium]